MKKTKKVSPYVKKFPVQRQNQNIALVPVYVLMPLWFVSLCVPNLIYSGIKFADTLHILKWAITGVPVAIAVFVAGVRLAIYGRNRINIKLDIFAVLWGLILAYCAVQPLWVNIFSPTGFVLELLCFLTVWAFYVISVASFPDWGLRPVLLLGNLNAAINTAFAELQIRNINNFSFLDGTFLEPLKRFSDIILPTPGNYIGNTAQQNMFGLWTAVATIGAIYLFAFDVWKNDDSQHGRKIFIPVLNMMLVVVALKFAITENSMLLAILAALLGVCAFILAWRMGNDIHSYYSIVVLFFVAVNSWGLFNSTSRSATIALILGLIVIFILTAWKFNRYYLIRFGAVILLVGTVFWAAMYSPRSGQLVGKTIDIIQHAENIGNRRGIWTTSFAMAREHPQGVGIGQYKWHYMEAQREAFKTVNTDWYNWQYTHWAHNEFLQFFCEGGIIGGIIFMIMYFSSFMLALTGLFRNKTISINSVWALGLATLVTFSAVFTRPFHRIENMVWITLAFAISNREFFRDNLKFDVLKSNLLCRLSGLACVCASVAGCLYIWSGIYGNYVLREALSTQNASLQMYLLELAEKHPIVYEETMRNKAYHYIQLGEQTEDNETLHRGFMMLWEHFNHEPHSEDIGRILNLSQRFQDEGIMREITSYFKPGTYHLQRVLQTTSDGRLFNALMIMNGPEPDNSDDQQ